LDQKLVLSIPCSSVSEEICKDEDQEEEKDLFELAELVENLSTEIKELKAYLDCGPLEEDAEDILVLEVDSFGIPAHGEVVKLSIDLEQPNFNEYPNREDNEKRFSMVPVYHNDEFDSWESHEK
jgi:hypothetical protein